MKLFSHESKAHFLPIYLTSFLFALHIALPLYVNSSFLGQFLPQNALGFVYAASSLLVIALLARFPDILSRIGNYRAFLCITGAQALLLIVLSLPVDMFVAIPVFVVAQALVMLGVFSLDVFLERFSKDTATGVTRGILLTTANFAILLGPVSVALILSNGDFWKVYLAGALCVTAAGLVIATRLKSFKDPEYRTAPYIKTLVDVALARHPNDEIRHAVIASFVLRFFYSWMVIYTPLYLNTVMGFSWGDIGVILGIMLLPFVLFQLPVGYLSDKYVGEKKLMTGGFLVMSAFTAALFFAAEPSLALWAGLLFMTRVGASIVEITAESYFFKHIESSDTEILSFYRNAEPPSSLIAPIAASLLLSVAPMVYLFPVLAGVLLFGVWSASRMKPTAPAAQKSLV